MTDTIAKDRDARLAFLGLSDQSRSDLRAAWSLVRPHLPSLIDGFYAHITRNPDLVAILDKGPEIPVLKTKQAEHWEILFSGSFDGDFFERAKRIGDAHALIGLDPRYYIAGYTFFLQRVQEVLIRGKHKPESMTRQLNAITSAIMLDMDLAISAYNTKGEVEKVKEQSLAVVEMLEREIQMTVEDVAAQAAHMSEMSRSLKDAAQALTQLVGEVRDASNEASENVGAVAAATEELNASSAEIARQVSGSVQVTAKASDEAQEAQALVEGLSAAAQKISGVVDLINTIATQTKMLALNATIEAARAGDAGKGFAVVASEVKSLANQTEQAVKDVNDQVGGVRSATGKANQAITSIAKKINEVDDMSGSIAAAIEEQNAATGEIGRSADQASSATGHAAGSIQDVAQQVQQSEVTATKVDDLAELVSKSILDMRRRLVIVVRSSFTGNRRTEDRLAAVEAVRLQLGGKTFDGFIADLSQRGCMVLPSDPKIDLPKVDQAILIMKDGLSFSLAVMGMTETGIHCRFQTIDKAQSDRVRKIMTEAQAQNDRYSNLCQTAANQAAAALQSALDQRRIAVEDLFDAQYAPVHGSDPLQFTTRYSELTDSLFPAIQDRTLAADPAIRMVCATDRNGYIPTHNAAFSKPQRPGETEWNLANSRNRRIFDDRPGLVAATNQRPMLVQTYPRVLDSGHMELLKEIDCPIRINDRLWGNMRLAFLP
ncbi:protoglobin domain-containing protein [Rhodospirillum sp. A1_3_36]|uniref:protoglobin domain-containing protein n=1 Tax=Rhodospirillum sp. A1_3_36 TaxID=3391666 RepID=UPI0039A4E530